MQLESFVASMSTGAVAPGDGVGMSNASLIFRSIRTDGLLLKPSRPMSSVDYWYSQQAFTESGVQWQLQETYTELQGLRWHYVMGVDIDRETRVTARMLHINVTAEQRYVAYRASASTNHYATAHLLNATHPLTLPATTLPDFTIYYVAPVLANALVLYGERDKWVRVSPQRIHQLSWQTAPFVLTIALVGEAGERVVMEFADVRVPTKVYAAECVMDATGQASVTVQASGQWACHTQWTAVEREAESVKLLATE